MIFLSVSYNNISYNKRYDFFSNSVCGSPTDHLFRVLTRGCSIPYMDNTRPKRIHRGANFCGFIDILLAISYLIHPWFLELVQCWQTCWIFQTIYSQSLQFTEMVKRRLLHRYVQFQVWTVNNSIKIEY